MKLASYYRKPLASSAPVLTEAGNSSQLETGRPEDRKAGRGITTGATFSTRLDSLANMPVPYS